MRKIVECVPNFSEGRDKNIIEAIADEIRRTKGAKLLNVEPDADYNRVVVTFAGEPDGVVEAAFAATKKAYELIDMRKHKGEHPRMGAADVVPFVPVSGVTMEECIELSKRYAKKVADELNVPIYLYENSATKPERKNLSNIRAGEYEGLPEKLKDPEWKPDFGPAKFVPRYGATATGARFFLIAYNVNLNTEDKNIANEIARRIRESGRKLKREDGTKERVPGRFKATKAMGVYLENYNITQVSINLVNYRITAPHEIFEGIKHDAAEFGVEVTGSEIVGLVPLEAMLMAGKYQISKKKGIIPLDERKIVDIAIEYLGLSDLYKFKPEKKIIEYMV